ncbi:MAG: DHH family phosphoesterase [Nanoarchaeota archaeon]|nr:DHH family phosphoesterase [Nanoarchaeota archaeon]
MINKIKSAIESIDEASRKKSIKVISHYDADGITSAAIFSRALQRWGKRFSIEIVKGLEESFIKSLPEDHVLIFLDLASGSLAYLKDKKTEVFVFDHHEITEDVPPNITMISTQLFHSHEPLSGAAICYLFAKALSPQNKDLATLAVIGMVGDSHEKLIGKIFSEILQDAETIIKKGLLLYPSTRHLDKALEYSSSPYIPGVTGSYKGVIDLLREAGIQNEGGKYKALYELNDEEMSKLITAILLRSGGKANAEQIVGNLYLVKFFNRMEDARELSALINACSRMDRPFVSLGFCLGNKKMKDEAEKIYIEYKQSLVSALRFVSEVEKISGKNYIIINAKDKIKDTIIGTVASIMSHSPVYPEGSIIIALAYNNDKIKVSARLSGSEGGRNVREVLHQVVVPLGGEVGGHPSAAGCLISKEQEGLFIDGLKRILDVELVKV